MEQLAEQKLEKRTDEIFVGNNKPASVYIDACITQLNDGKKEITLRARGKAIVRAVDVSQILIRKYKKEMKISKVEVGTESIDAKDFNGKKTGNIISVSSILIKIS